MDNTEDMEVTKSDVDTVFAREVHNLTSAELVLAMILLNIRDELRVAARERAKERPETME